MPVSKKRRKLANASAEQATRKRLLTSPLARAEADRIILQIRVALEAIRSGRSDGTALLLLHSVVMLTELLTEEGRGTLPLDMVRDTGRGVAIFREQARVKHEWALPDALRDALMAIVNEYDRMMHQVPLQTVLAATGKLERLENDDPQHFRFVRDNNGAPS
ncbi:hypothetical protein AB4Y32_37610 [Paraburkholderia phymatum]|uniref:Uncharacterized protein n=1 Tax=Paraburkholderia phymatum TaxID=148447 RepID=A0ACC6UCL7_9BURK